jgi:hypothetical protein
VGSSCQLRNSDDVLAGEWDGTTYPKFHSGQHNVLVTAQGHRECGPHSKSLPVRGGYGDDAPQLSSQLVQGDRQVCVTYMGTQ